MQLDIIYFKEQPIIRKQENPNWRHERKKKSKWHVFVFSFMGILFKRFASLGFLKICTFLKNRGTQAWDAESTSPRDVP